jgi:hypothetical protein
MQEIDFVMTCLRSHVMSDLDHQVNWCNEALHSCPFMVNRKVPTTRYVGQVSPNLLIGTSHYNED